MKILSEKKLTKTINLVILLVISGCATDKLNSPQKRLQRLPAIQEQREWALACSAVLAERNHDNHDTLNPCEINERNINQWKLFLKNNNMGNREDLLWKLIHIELEGHRQKFNMWGQYIQTLTKEEYNKLLAEHENDEEIYNEIKIAEKYYQKLRDKSILGWDCGRYIYFCRLGYLVGYLSEDEAWQLIMPVAQLLQKVFDSWEDLGQNYIIGRKFWCDKCMNEQGYMYEDAIQRLKDMPSSPWNKYPWDMYLGCDTNTANIFAKN